MGVQDFQISPIGTGHAQFFKQMGELVIPYTIAFQTGFVCQGARQKAFAGSGRTFKWLPAATVVADPSARRPVIYRRFDAVWHGAIARSMIDH